MDFVVSFFLHMEQLFLKKNYVSLKGAKFIAKGFLFFIKGLYDGYNDALTKNKINFLM